MAAQVAGLLAFLALLPATPANYCQLLPTITNYYQLLPTITTKTDLDVTKALALGDKLTAVLLYHVAIGALSPEELAKRELAGGSCMVGAVGATG